MSPSESVRRTSAVINLETLVDNVDGITDTDEGVDVDDEVEVDGADPEIVDGRDPLHTKEELEEIESSSVSAHDVGKSLD